MTFSQTPLPGAYTIAFEPHGDERGWFMRNFCQTEFAAAGIDFQVNQINRSLTAERGMIRGMHFQIAEAAEAKVISCTRGRVFDVGVDLRPDSPTYRQWFGVELSEDSYQALYLPKGFAHGFQTLTPNCEMFYLMSDPYMPTAAAGVRYNDPALAITWPLPKKDIKVGERDAVWPLLDVTS